MKTILRKQIKYLTQDSSSGVLQIIKYSFTKYTLNINFVYQT